MYISIQDGLAESGRFLVTGDSHAGDVSYSHNFLHESTM